MWEYGQSRTACVMDQSNLIHRTPNSAPSYNSIFPRDTFSRLINSAHKQLIDFVHYARTFAISVSLPGEFLGGLAYMATGIRQLSFGEAVQMITEKDCFLFRDGLIAIRILTSGNMLYGHARPLPESDIDACAEVWPSALAANDYSAMLLQPRVRVTGSNPDSDVPSFFVGYRDIEGAEWDLGHQNAPANQPPVSVSSTVQLMLDIVGEIEAIYYLDVEDSGEIDGVDWAIQVLRTTDMAERTPLSPEKLVDGLNRIFPVEDSLKHCATSGKM
jgi:hypothetical protein